MRRPLGLLLGAALALVAGEAIADNDDCKSAEGNSAWTEGNRLWNIDKPEDAIAKWETAYLLCGAPELLFNLGQASRKVKRYQDAIRYFKRWLAEDEQAEQQEREAVRAILPELVRLTEDKKTSAEQAAAPVAPPAERPASAPTTPSAPERAAEPWYRDRAGWVLIATGVVAVSVGGALWLHGDSLYDDAQTEPDETEVQSLIDSANTYRVLGGVLFVVSIAVAGAGGIKLAITEPPSNEATGVAIGPGWFIVRGTF
jgi:tetratricopeptide (TPR) repeat protein